MIFDFQKLYWTGITADYGQDQRSMTAMLALTEDSAQSSFFPACCLSDLFTRIPRADPDVNDGWLSNCEGVIFHVMSVVIFFSALVVSRANIKFLNADVRLFETVVSGYWADGASKLKYSGWIFQSPRRPTCAKPLGRRGWISEYEYFSLISL